MIWTYNSHVIWAENEKLEIRSTSSRSLPLLLFRRQRRRRRACRRPPSSPNPKVRPLSLSLYLAIPSLSFLLRSLLSTHRPPSYLPNLVSRPSSLFCYLLFLMSDTCMRFFRKFVVFGVPGKCCMCRTCAYFV